MEELGFWSPDTVSEIVAAADALGAKSFGGRLSPRELALINQVSVAKQVRLPSEVLTSLKSDILRGNDPLGEQLIRLRSLQVRRRLGMFYTPPRIVQVMVDWVLRQKPDRIVDPGCGSGRFVAEVVRNSRNTEVIAIDLDPIATLITRAVLGIHGAGKSLVLNADYMRLALERISGKTAFVGNPPYVRHHTLSQAQKRWAKDLSESLGLHVSGLAGLHVHFFINTYGQASRGDVACFITSSEWLDVRYGAAIRLALLDGLGVVSMHLIDPRALAFPDAMTTGLITCMEVGRRAGRVKLQYIRAPEEIEPLADEGQQVPYLDLSKAKRWGAFFFVKKESAQGNLVRLGDIARVSRGTATGANSFFVMADSYARVRGLIPHTVPVLTSAKEIFQSGGIVRAASIHNRLLAPNVDRNLATEENGALRQYLNEGRRHGVAQRYLCRHRSVWWRVEVKTPIIIATYMARQAPAFAFNPDRVAILNVIHGIFPKVPLTQEQLSLLVRYLNDHREDFRGSGRTYQGGLEKFEPGEMEDLRVPLPESLAISAG